MSVHSSCRNVGKVFCSVLPGVPIALICLSMLTGCATLSPQSGSHKPVCPRKSLGTPPRADGTGLDAAARIIGPKPNACPRPSRTCARRSVSTAAGGRASASFVSYQVPNCPGQAGSRGMCWPAIGTVTRPFDASNSRNGTNHRGIDICAAEGAPVYAAKAGKVVYAGDQLSGYGRMIIIDHGGELATVYAHNRANMVRVGERVRRGQAIAEVGQTGNATTPHLHFEIRQKATPVDPLRMLQ